MRKVLLRSWDRVDKACEVQPEIGKPEWRRVDANEKLLYDGFVKSCFFGPALMVYQVDGVWFFQVKKRRWLLGDSALHLEAWPWAGLTRIVARFEDWQQTFVYAQPLDFLARKLDPTYDGLDAEMADFPRWLAKKRQESKHKAKATETM